MAGRYRNVHCIILYAFIYDKNIPVCFSSSNLNELYKSLSGPKFATVYCPKIKIVKVTDDDKNYGN